MAIWLCSRRSPPAFRISRHASDPHIVEEHYVVRIRLARPLAIVGLVVAALASLMFVGSGTASADTQKCTPIDNLFDTSYICVETSGTNVYGLLIASINSATIYVTQCRGDLTACGTIAANSTNTPNLYGLSTSSKPMAHGHVYRSCASWTESRNGSRYTNFCSPWLAYP
jgi:hypothetical protein